MLAAGLMEYGDQGCCHSGSGQPPVNRSDPRHGCARDRQSTRHPNEGGVCGSTADGPAGARDWSPPSHLRRLERDLVWSFIRPRGPRRDSLSPSPPADRVAGQARPRERLGRLGGAKTASGRPESRPASPDSPVSPVLLSTVTTLFLHVPADPVPERTSSEQAPAANQSNQRAANPHDTPRVTCNGTVRRRATTLVETLQARVPGSIPAGPT